MSQLYCYESKAEKGQGLECGTMYDLVLFVWKNPLNYRSVNKNIRRGVSTLYTRHS